MWRQRRRLRRRWCRQSFSFAAACPPSGTGISAQAAPLPTLPVCHSSFAAAFGSATADRKQLLGFLSEWRLWLLRWWRLPQAAYAKHGCGGGGCGGYYPYVVFNCVGTQAPAALHSMISGSLIFSTEKSVGMKTFSHFMSLLNRIGWTCVSRRMGPRVVSDGPADQVGWARGSGRMGRVG